MEKIPLVKHHARQFIPDLVKDSPGIPEIDGKDIFFRLGIASVDYSFLWEEGKLTPFVEAIQTAVNAYREGRIMEVEENQKNLDIICRACGNFINGVCIIENCDS